MVEVNNLTKIDINKKWLENIAEKVLRKEDKKLDISIAIIDKEEIKKLNRKYRKKNKPTDVLSFLYDNFGELVFCPQIMEENAKSHRISFNQELKRVLIHGLLHLTGEDHEKSKMAEERMRAKEDYYLNFK